MTSIFKGFGATLLAFVVCCSSAKHATLAKDGIEYMPNRYGFTRDGRICIRGFEVRLDDSSPDKNRRLTEAWGKDLTRYLKSEFTRVGLQIFDANSECPDAVQRLACVLIKDCHQENYVPPSGKVISKTNWAQCVLSDGGSPRRVRRYSGTGSGRYYVYSLSADMNTNFQAGGEAFREMIYAIVTDTIGAMDSL